MSEPSYKFSIIGRISKISTYFLFISWTRPFLDALVFLWVCTDSLFADYVSQDAIDFLPNAHLDGFSFKFAFSRR